MRCPVDSSPKDHRRFETEDPVTTVGIVGKFSLPWLSVAGPPEYQDAHEGTGEKMWGLASGFAVAS